MSANESLVGKEFIDKDAAPWTRNTFKVIKDEAGYVGYACKPYFMYWIFGVIDLEKATFLKMKKPRSPITK